MISLHVGHSYYERETTWKKYGPKRHFRYVFVIRSPSANIFYGGIHIELYMRRWRFFGYLRHIKIPLIEQVTVGR